MTCVINTRGDQTVRATAWAKLQSSLFRESRFSAVEGPLGGFLVFFVLLNDAVSTAGV